MPHVSAARHVDRDSAKTAAARQLRRCRLRSRRYAEPRPASARLPRPATFASRATRSNIDYICAAASAATRTATLVAPAPRLSSARALSPSPSRAVVASQGSITSPPLLSLSATPSSALAACRASRRGTGRSAARFAAKAKTKNYPAGGSEPPCRATAASSPKRTLLSDDNSNTPFGLSSNQKTDGAADARTVLYQRVTSTSQPSLLVTP